MSQKSSYHFIGIGGIGMSALARILLEKKIPVSGSDIRPNFNTESLTQKGATVSIGHSSALISPLSTVVYSSDIPHSNPEYQAALEKNCRMIHRSDLLCEIMNEYKSLAVTGTHGKTTTSSLLATVLMGGGLDPSFALGGLLEGTNGKTGKGDYFVAEADESDGSFLKYFPQGAIITNIEKEHMEFFKTEKRLEESFSQFFEQVQNPDLLFYCADDPILKKLSAGRGISYGFHADSQLYISSFHQKEWSCVFDFHFNGHHYSSVEIPLVGSHNVLNASAVFGMALQLGIPEYQIREALKSFPGVGRRCQKIAVGQEVLLIDDYGHHPTEVFKTLFAIRQAIAERRMIVIFQPHRFTRLRDHLEAFASCFDCADKVYVTDIYSAGEKPIDGVSTEKVILEIRSQSTVLCERFPDAQRLEFLANLLRPHDVVVTIGAGDITYFHHELAIYLKQNPVKKFKVGLVFGGRSCEHEISLRSSRFVNASLNRSFYDVFHFAVDKQGNWICGEEASDILEKSKTVVSENAKPLLVSDILNQLQSCDLFFPVMHGPFGEDGTFQGFFELIGKPYAGPGFRGAAICMDKVLTKKLVKEAGVPTPNYVSFGYWEWLRDSESLLSKINALQFPVFVKPSHVGSSVGITKVETPENVRDAIALAFRFDTTLLVEEGKMSCRELEFAVMGNHSSAIVAPAPGEKLATGQFVDYEMKYGLNAVKTSISPELSESILEKGKEFARRAYEAVGNSGMTRVDFLLDHDGNFWFFEMNPIPGLTPLSLFPKIWNREGVPGDKLMDRLIILGLERHREQMRHLNPL